MLQCANSDRSPPASADSSSTRLQYETDRSSCISHASSRERSPQGHSYGAGQEASRILSSPAFYPIKTRFRSLRNIVRRLCSVCGGCGASARAAASECRRRSDFMAESPMAPRAWEMSRLSCGAAATGQDPRERSPDGRSHFTAQRECDGRPSISFLYRARPRSDRRLSVMSYGSCAVIPSSGVMQRGLARESTISANFILQTVERRR
jgi:hypothetical protein